MRWWAGAWMIAGMVALAACGGPSGGSSGSGTGPSRPPSSAAGESSAAPSARATGASPSESVSASAPASASASAAPHSCAAGHTEVTVLPGDPVRQRVCVRPGAVVSLVLDPRADDKRWTAVRSSAPALVQPSGWRPAADGTVRVSLRCAGTRGGAAAVTVLAKEPDLAGTGGVAFTLEVDVVPHTTAG